MKTGRIRYKHKLNMLEPGIIFCKVIGLLVLLGAGFYILGCECLAYTVWGIAAFAALILFVLLCIEQHQDKVLYEQTKHRTGK